MTDLGRGGEGWRGGGPGDEKQDFSEKILNELGWPKNGKNALTSNANYCKQKNAFASRMTTVVGVATATPPPQPPPLATTKDTDHAR